MGCAVSDLELPELTKLPLAQRLGLMETLWDSLSREGQHDAVVPPWHEEVLGERARRIDSGEESTTPWPEAKARLLKLTRSG